MRTRKQTFQKVLQSLAGAATIAAVCLLTGCNGGRAGSRLHRQGVAPVYDFPMYVTEGVPGKIWKYTYERTRTLLASGLNDPRGIATDRFNNLYVVEQAGNRVLKIDVDTGITTVLRENLDVPSVVAVDSTGQVYVAQDGPKNILRVYDNHVVATFTDARPSAIAFGVNDLLLYGLYDTNTVGWGIGGVTTASTVQKPTNISTDQNGRVFVSEGSDTGGRIWRFNQRNSGGATIVADTMQGLAGMAVDPVGNIYAVEQGASRIVLITFDGHLFTWVSDPIDPQYIALTQF